MRRQLDKLATVRAHVHTETIDAHDIEMEVKLLIGQDRHNGVLRRAHVRIWEKVGAQIPLIKRESPVRNRLESESSKNDVGASCASSSAENEASGKPPI